MPYNKYLQVSKERYDNLYQNYLTFMEAIYDNTKESVKIFEPLGPQQVKELLVIREVSVELQKKKDEDLRKAAEAAAEAEVKAKEAAAQKAEESAESTLEDTTVDSNPVDATPVEA